MTYTRILATGGYLPTTILSNADLEKRVDTTHEWIVERTGIHNRHIASKDETTMFMACEAAKRALETAGISKDTIDMIIVATCTPDKVFPSTACLVQEALDIPNCPAFDLQAACSGFIYGLSIIDQFIRQGTVKRALLIGSESMSRIIDWNDRRTCVLFGDGAGAVILEASTTPGVLSTELSADGRQKDILYLENKPGAFVSMQGNAVYKLAVNRFGEAAMSILLANGLTVAEVDWFVPHQANIRIILATAEKLGLPQDHIIFTLANQGNTSAASVPLALDAGIREGKIKRGQHLLLEAFGGGLTWGTALIKY